MAEQKAPAKKERVYLGRPGNNVSMGVVGMPNVGKSTMFNLLSNLHVPAENYPFCTIDPNVAKVPVPDKRFDFLCDFYKPKSKVPSVLTVTDIAGLVKGASEGKGLGNAFLSHIAAVDGIYHLVRAFKDDTIEHVEGEVDPVRDLTIISEELLLKDKEVLDKNIESIQKILGRGQDKTKKAELETLMKVKEWVESKKDVREGEWSGKDVEVLNRVQLLSAKPVVYLVNLSKPDFIAKKNKWLKPIADWVAARSPGAPIIPFSGMFEAEYADMTEEVRKKIFEESKAQTMLPKIIITGYSALDLTHFFTSGEDEVRAWTIRRNLKAPQAAGVIHTDFERGFIAAEVMAFDDFKACGSEAAVKAAGKYKTQGKLYDVQDGDICYFKFNVSGGKQTKK